MSTFMRFTELYTNRPILLNISAIVTLAPVMEDGKVIGTRVTIGDREEKLDVKEPIEAFFQQPPQSDPPDSGKAEVSTEGVPI